MFKKKTEYTYNLKELVKTAEGELVATVSLTCIKFVVRKTPLNANVKQVEESDSCFLCLSDMTPEESIIFISITDLRGGTELRAIWTLFWHVMERQSWNTWFDENIPGLLEFYKSTGML
jgi:hypothetical protein